MVLMLGEVQLYTSIIDRFLSEEIRTNSSSVISESQYKYQIKKWKLKKSTSTPKKAALYQVIQKRAELGKTSAVTRSGKNFDTKNLRRYLKTEARRTTTLQPILNGVATDTGLLSGRVAQFGNRM